MNTENEKVKNEAGKDSPEQAERPRTPEEERAEFEVLSRKVKASAKEGVEGLHEAQRKIDGLGAEASQEEVEEGREIMAEGERVRHVVDGTAEEIMRGKVAKDESGIEPVTMEIPKGTEVEMKGGSKVTKAPSTLEGTEIERGIAGKRAAIGEKIAVEQKRMVELAKAKEKALAEARAGAEGRSIEEDEAVFAAVAAMDAPIKESEAEVVRLQMKERRLRDGEDLPLQDFGSVRSFEDLNGLLDAAGGAYDARQMAHYSPEQMREIIDRVRSGADPKILSYSDGLRETVVSLLAQEAKSGQDAKTADLVEGARPNEETLASGQEFFGGAAGNGKKGDTQAESDAFVKAAMERSKQAVGKLEAFELSKIDIEFNESEEGPAVISEEAALKGIVDISSRDGADDDLPSLEALASMAKGRMAEAKVAADEDAEWSKKAADAKRYESHPNERPRSSERLDDARSRVMALEADLKRYEGVSGKIALLSVDKRLAKAELDAKLASAKKEYNERRAEYVGDEVVRMLAERAKLVDERIAALDSEKGWASKAYDAYKKLGEKNIGTALGWEPQGSVMKRVVKAANARTAISLMLLGVGVASGAGSAVGITALLGRRVLSGAGAGIGAYDLMRRSGERAAVAHSKEEIAKMSALDLFERLGRLEATALLDGRSPASEPGYEALREAVLERDMGDDSRAPEVVPNFEGGVEGRMKAMRTLLDREDANIEASFIKAKSDDRRRKIVAGALGALIGGGTLAKAFGNVTAWSADTDAGKVAKSGFRWAKEKIVSRSPEIASARAAVESLRAATPESAPKTEGWVDAAPPGEPPVAEVVPAAPAKEVVFEDADVQKVVAAPVAAEALAESPEMVAAEIAKAREALKGFNADFDKASSAKSVQDGLGLRAAGEAASAVEKLTPAAQVLEDARKAVAELGGEKIVGVEAAPAKVETSTVGVRGEAYASGSKSEMRTAFDPFKDTPRTRGVDGTAANYDLSRGFKTPLGNEASFKYAQDGRIMAFEHGGGLPFEVAATGLDPKWGQIIEMNASDARDYEVFQKEFRIGVSRVHSYEQGLQALESDPVTRDSSEAQFLRAKVAAEKADINSRFGKVYKEVGAAPDAAPKVTKKPPLGIFGRIGQAFKNFRHAIGRGPRSIPPQSGNMPGGYIPPKR